MRNGSLFSLQRDEKYHKINTVMNAFSLFAASVAIVLPAAQAVDAWLTDFSKAQAQAQAEQKPIVLDFTGSDWCGWCMTMRRMVLDTPEFYDYARDKFVLLEVDLPRNTSKMTQAHVRQNQELINRYKVTTFPTVLVITAEGKVIGGFTGGRTDLASVTQALDMANVNATLLNSAKTQTGVKKAHSLKTFYWNMPGVFRRDMHDLRKEIAALDPDNETGMHTELQDISILEDLVTTTKQQSSDTAIDLIIHSLTKVSDSHRSDVLQMLAEQLNKRIQRTREQADSLADIESMRRDNLMFIKYCLPADSHKTAIERLNSEFANPQTMLENLRSEREYRLKYKK